MDIKKQISALADERVDPLAEDFYDGLFIELEDMPGFCKYSGKEVPEDHECDGDCEPDTI
jgi:hypothetical protein